MKFSTRIDIDRPPAEVFDMMADFSRIERMLMRRGIEIGRAPAGAGASAGSSAGALPGWLVGFDWRGRRRDLRLDLTRSERPEHLAFAGQSEAFGLTLAMTVVALSRRRSRLLVELDLRPRNLRSRLMIQTAKLARPRLDRQFDRRMRGFVAELAAAA